MKQLSCALITKLCLLYFIVSSIIRAQESIFAIFDDNAALVVTYTHTALVLAVALLVLN